jgi:inorganic pyrophosphatase
MQLEKIYPRGEERHLFRAVIETSRGSRNKYSYDADERVFVLKKVLPEGHVFPFDFGFIPRTKGEDGDPLDVLVMMDEPAFAGCVVECRLICVVECRLIGVLRAKQSKKHKMLRNDRFVAVAETSLNFKRLKDIEDLEPDMLQQVQQFFVSYNTQAGKKFKVEKILGAKKARELAQAK